MEENITREDFFRDLNNYVMINNDIYRFDYSDPGQLNLNVVNKAVFKSKFGFTEEDYRSLPEFDGFTVEPQHLEYSQSVGGKWNLYNRVDFKSCEGEWPHIEKLLRHLYGENAVETDQLEEIYDYHTVLLKNPKQLQQARVLYSHQQGTSKSALAVLENAMFGSNYSKIRENELTGEFNAIWVRSLLVHMDEPFFSQPKSMSRKIRDMITTDKMNLRKMKTDHQEIPFYGKLLFTTNDSNFMPIEPGDRRYWIREVPMYKKENEDPHFNDKMIKEIPHYLHFLLNREMKYKEKSDKTFWLPYEAISTSNAFNKMVQDSKADYQVVAEEILQNWFVSHPLDNDVVFTMKELQTQVAHELNVKFDKIPRHDFTVLLRDIWGLETPAKTTRPKKNDKLLGMDIDRNPGRWWKAPRAMFEVELDVFTDVRM